MRDLIFSNAGWFSGATLGAAVLIAIVAGLIGYVVARVWPSKHHPQTFGFLAATFFVAALAAFGSTAAAMAIVLMIALSLIALVFGVF